MGSLHALPPAADAEPADLFDVDVLVIGASQAGVQAALAAAGQGLRVLVVERSNAAALPPAGLVTTGRARKVLWLTGHHALELLLDTGGAVRGASGISHSGQPDDRHERPWRALAAAVVMATAQGLLMAAEAGAVLGGMDGDAGSGGLRQPGGSGATTVAGLYAAGRAAWAGAGLPRHSTAGALLTGQQAGLGAAAEARRLAAAHGRNAPAGHHKVHQPSHPPGDRPLRPAGNIGLRGTGSHPINPQATRAALQAVLAPVAHAASSPAAALRRLDALWHFLRNAAPAPSGALRATRDAAARLAEARWRLRSLIARQHGAGQPRAIVTGGLDEVWAETEASVWPLGAEGAADGADDAAHHADGTTFTVAPARPERQRLAAFAR